jgi:hypothetical protein
MFIAKHLLYCSYAILQGGKDEKSSSAYRFFIASLVLMVQQSNGMSIGLGIFSLVML